MFAGGVSSGLRSKGCPFPHQSSQQLVGECGFLSLVADLSGVFCTGMYCMLPTACLIALCSLPCSQSSWAVALVGVGSHWCLPDWLAGWLVAWIVGCLLACLLARSLACLLARLLAWLVASCCFLAFLLAFWLTWLVAWSLACSVTWSLACLVACLLARLVACLVDC